MQWRGVMQLINALKHKGSRYKDITPQAAYEARGSARLVDVREADELAAGGFIPGVEHVPLATVTAAAQRWTKDEPIVLICRSGGRSSRAAEALVAMGFTNVMNMAGGMLAYGAARLPLARS